MERDDRRLERSDRGERGAELRLRARDVEVSAAAGGALGLRQLQHLLLVLDVGAGDGELCLLAAQLEVVARHLGDHRDLCVVQVGHFALQLGIARLDVASDTAEEVQLPGASKPAS